MKVSTYKKYNSNFPTHQDLFKVLDSIKSGTYEEQIKNVRLFINDKPKKDIEKKKLPLVSFCGTFKVRSNSKLIKHNGLACLDFDHLPNLSETRKKVDEDKHTYCSFISPSGDGLKVLCKIPFVSSDKDYKSYYIELQKYYNKYGKTDDATKDISRATFLSFDPDLYFNADSLIFTDRFIPKEIVKEVVSVPLKDMDEVSKRIVVWFKKKWTTGENRNNNLFILASAFNNYGVDKLTALSYCLNYSTVDFNDREIELLVDSAYKKTENFGIKHFEDLKVVKKIKKLVNNDKTLDEVKKIIGDSKGVEKVYKEEAEKISPDEFWTYNDKDVIKLATFRFLNYLEKNNISKYYPDNESDTFIFIKKENNFLMEFGESKIKDFTLNDLRKRGEIDAFEMMANTNNNFSTQYLSMIGTTDIKLNRDDKYTSYIYYKNGAVKTTKDNIDIVPYEKIDSLIWKNQVINREIDIVNESEGEFKTFLWKLSAENKDRYYTLKSVVGYLMHSYQNDSKPKSIIFNDEMISEGEPNGGSGKGLIHKAIGQIKNIVLEDGKKFDPTSQFAYQKINKDTQIFLIDDVSKHFNFENLFSVITGGITVEKKNKDAYQIPFEENPKISITTNYTIKGDGPSYRRRAFEVEIANYFNDVHTPEDEFGHQFFSDWDEAEWKRFDNYMIRCVQFFLKNGLVESNKVNLDFRKLKNNLGVDFLEFIDSKEFDGNPINRKDLRDEFNRQYPNLSRYNTAQKFNNKVKEYCDFYKIKFEETKYNGSMHFIIGEPTETEEDPF